MLDFLDVSICFVCSSIIGIRTNEIVPILTLTFPFYARFFLFFGRMKLVCAYEQCTCTCNSAASARERWRWCTRSTWNSNETETKNDTRFNSNEIYNLKIACMHSNMMYSKSNSVVFFSFHSLILLLFRNVRCSLCSDSYVLCFWPLFFPCHIKCIASLVFY